MAIAGRVLGVAAALLGAGCTGAGWVGHAAEAAPARAHAAAPAPRPPPARCPMAVPYTAVAAEDTPDGAAITFTTAEPEALGRLRDSVRAMAERLAAGAAGGPDGAPAPAAAPLPVRAAVEEVSGGARVTLTPEDRADLARLRATVQERADRMSRTGACDAGA